MRSIGAAWVVVIVAAVGSFVRDASAQDSHYSLKSGSSPFAPPKATDCRYVIDSGAGLDTGCTFNDEGDLVIQLPINRYVGDIAKLRQNNLIGSKALVRMPAYDVDYAGASGLSPERDVVYINGHIVPTQYLTGTDSVWKMNAFEIPIEWLKFPASPVGSDPVNGELNEIRIVIDTLNPSGAVWCTSIDWVAIEIGVVAPIVLAHGILSDSNDCWGKLWLDELDKRGIPHEQPDMGWLDSINDNAAEIEAVVETACENWAVDKVNLVCHSKGGIDARHYAEHSKRVHSVVQLGTPNGGSPLADKVQSGLIVACFYEPWICLLKAFTLFATPAAKQLTTDSMKSYNKAHGWNSSVQYSAVAGDYTPNCFVLSSFSCAKNTVLLALSGGDGDTIVPLWSVGAVPFISVQTHPSSGTDTSATHSGLHDSEDVMAMVADIVFSKKRGTESTAPAIAQATIPLQSGPTQMTALSPGATQSFDFQVPTDVTAVEFTAIHGGEATLRMIDPTGKTYEPNPAANNQKVTFGEGDMLDLTVSRFRFEAPKPGTWIAKLKAKGTASDFVSVILSVGYEGSPIVLEATATPESLAASGAAKLTASVKEGGTPLTNVTFETLISKPDGMVVSIGLHDDGIAPDVAPSDGQYSASFQDTLSAGQYLCIIRATGQSPTGTAFARESNCSFMVATAGSTLTGAFTSAGVDLDADTLFDALAIDVGFVAGSSGDFLVKGILKDSQGHEIEASSAIHLGAPGPSTAKIEFPGEILYANAVNGPYLLKTIHLSLDALDGTIPLASLDNAHQTAAFAFNKFEHEPIALTGTNSDTGIDTDADGLFNQLRVVLGVQLDVGGFHEWSARLIDAGGTEVGFTSGSGSLLAGKTSITLNFDGTKIGSEDGDGPFVVRDLLMSGNAGSLVTGAIHTTQDYDANDFEGFLGPKFRPGDRLTGTAGAVGLAAKLRFDAVAGMSLVLKPKKTALKSTFMLELEAPDGSTEVSATLQVGPKPSKRVLKPKTTGEYILHIHADGGALQTVEIVTSRKLPKKLVQQQSTVEAASGVATLLFAALPGSMLDLKIDPKGTATFDEIGLFDEVEIVATSSVFATDKKGNSIVDGLPLAKGGVYQVDIGGALDGAKFTLTSKITPPPPGIEVVTLEFQ